MIWILGLFLVGLISGCSASSIQPKAGATSQASAESSTPSSEQSWPTTCHAAIGHVVKDLDNESKQRVRNTRREDLILFHHGWGTGIRNEFGMWGGNTALVDSCIALQPGAQRHPDSASMIIIEGVWEVLRDEPSRGKAQPAVGADGGPK